MARTLGRKVSAQLTGGILAVSALVGPVHADPPVPLDQAGGLVGWGIPIGPADAHNVPAKLVGTPFSKVVGGAGFTVAITAAGKVVVLGKGYANGVSMDRVPRSVADATVVDVAVGGFSAAAVTSSGTVEVWGLHSDLPDAADVPAGLTGVEAVAVGQTSAAAVKVDGTVVAWGADRFGATEVPDGLRDVSSISAGDTHYYALKTDGTVAAWGSNNQGETTLPAELTVPGNVKAVAARSAGGLALLADGSLVSWGLSAGTPDVLNGVPGSLVGKEVVAISALSNNNMALDEDGGITVWGLGIVVGAGLGMGQLKQIPTELTGADVVGIAMGDEHAMALVSKVLEFSKPTVRGVPLVGEVLVGTPALFSGAPSAVTNQWFADSNTITGATDTSLLLTARYAGQRIFFVSTATRPGGDAVISTSEQTAAVEVPISSSATSVTAPRSTYGTSTRAIVSVVNAQGGPVPGTVQLRGAGLTQAMPAVLGSATFGIDRTLKPGRYALVASYSGSSGVASSSGLAALIIDRGKTRAPRSKATKVPTSRKKGAATVAIPTGHGLAKATGRAIVTLRKGRTVKKIRVKLSGGQDRVALPTLRKGTWRMYIQYAGDRNYVAQTSKSYTLAVTK